MMKYTDGDGCLSFSLDSTARRLTRRNFLPSATSALNVDNTSREFLAGWVAKGSDLYARVAQQNIMNVRRAVVRRDAARRVHGSTEDPARRHARDFEQALELDSLVDVAAQAYRSAGFSPGLSR